MTIELGDIARRLLQPLEPIPTDAHAELRGLPEVRAVLFDVYGTLVISASGDIGSTEQVSREAAFAEACTAANLPASVADLPGDSLLAETIRRDHDLARAAGNTTPEVDIRNVWTSVLDGLGCGPLTDRGQVERLASEYEMRVNPIWPMPSARQTLEGIVAADLALGIISNAQFYTPPTLEALFGEDLDSLGFAPDLRFFSYVSGQAKPGVELYQQAAAALAARNITPVETLYVGNDMLKDIMPASQIGFRTALFAGDARSLRLRREDARVADIHPDLIITELSQILGCVRASA